mmetsp:Transcript_6173/g.24897  ORF Transcript_6173/g.24897 Transcript_6173/m.24897 type:complete len:236 (-) Transcript_6173:78-785(-)
MGKLTPHEATMFWTLKSMNLAGKFNFWMIFAYLRAAKRESCSLFAPVQTILPDAKMSAVVFGSRMRIITAANRLGLYSAFLACRAMCFRSSEQPRFTVETMFCSTGTMPLGCCVRLTPSSDVWGRDAMEGACAAASLADGGLAGAAADAGAGVLSALNVGVTLAIEANGWGAVAAADACATGAAAGAGARLLKRRDCGALKLGCSAWKGLLSGLGGFVKLSKLIVTGSLCSALLL